MPTNTLTSTNLAASSAKLGLPSFNPPVVIHDYALDNGMIVFHTLCDRIYVCTGPITDFNSVTATGLGYMNFGTGNAFGGINNGFPSGRTVTSVPFTQGYISTGGLAVCWAAVDFADSHLLAWGVLSGNLLVSPGQLFGLPAFTIHEPAWFAGTNIAIPITALSLSTAADGLGLPALGIAGVPLTANPLATGGIAFSAPKFGYNLTAFSFQPTHADALGTPSITNSPKNITFTATNLASQAAGFANSKPTLSINSSTGAPVVTNNSTTLNLPAGDGTSVLTMAASNSPTSWSITAGNPRSAFVISSAGVISVATGAGTAPAGTFALTVQATNSSGSGSGTATVTSAMPPPPGYTVARRTFLEQFTGTTLNATVWQKNMGNTQFGTWTDGGKLSSPYSAVSNDAGGANDTVEYGDPNQVSVNYGLILTAVPSTLFAGQTNGTQYYTWKSGYIRTIAAGIFTGGYAQFLVRQPDTSTGAWPGVWFLNGSGEIDLCQGGFTTPHGNTNFNVAPATFTGGNNTIYVNVGRDLSVGYHIFGILYTPGSTLQMFCDGNLMGTFNQGPTTGNYEIILTLQMTGTAAAGFHTVASGSGPLVMNIAECQIYV